MNEQTQNQRPSPEQEEDEDSISLLDLLLVLGAGRKTIAKTTLGFTVAGLLYALVASNVYTGKTTFIPPSTSQLTPQSMAAQLGVFTQGAGLAAAFKNPGDLWVALLKSQTVERYVVQSQNYLEPDNPKKLAAAIKTLEGVSKITADKTGLVTIEVDDANPQRSADLANAYMTGLLELNKNLVFSQAGQKRLFFEQQLHIAREQLAEAEAFTEAELDPSNPVAGSVRKLLAANPRGLADAAQQLRARIAAKQVEISAMQSFAADRNTDLIRARDELASLEEQLSALEGVSTPKQLLTPSPNGPTADTTTNTEGGAATAPPTPQPSKPSLEDQIKARAKVQDIRYYDTLISTLTQQYEQSRLEESRDPVVFQIIDAATPPAVKSKPKRALIVIIATLAGFFFSILWVFLKNALGKAEANPETAAKLQKLQEDFPVRRWYADYAAPHINPLLAKAQPLYQQLIGKLFKRKP